MNITYDMNALYLYRQVKRLHTQIQTLIPSSTISVLVQYASIISVEIVLLRVACSQPERRVYSYTTRKDCAV